MSRADELFQGGQQSGRVMPFPRQPDTPEPPPEVLEAEFVDDAPRTGPQVNPGNLPAPLPWSTEPTRYPVLPPWLRDGEQRTHAFCWLAGYVWHTTVYHTVRVPVYAVLTVAYSARGAIVAVSKTWSYVTDAENKPLRSSAVRRDSLDEYMQIAKLRANRVRFRRIGFAVGLIALAGTVTALGFAPLGVQLTALALTALGLAKVGQPADRPIIGQAVVFQQAPKLTDNMVTRALGSLGIGELSRAAEKPGARGGITFTAPISRDGPGWRAEVELPLGITAGEVLKRREQLAAGVRRPLGCVWPEPMTGSHPGHLVLWVGDKDLSEQPKVRWPLAARGQHDYFQPIPFGQDPRGRIIKVPLFQHNVLMGAMPGQGKTAAVRVLTGGAALDPSVELWLHELKGTGDLDPYEQVSHRFISGIDDESMAYAAHSLHMLRGEVMRRASELKRLPRDLCPDKMVTRQIADTRSLKLHPLVCVIDECQNLFGHQDKEMAKQVADDAVFIIKIGRALAVTLILATQRPDAGSLPTGVSGNVSIRYCLKVAGQVENDMVLGTSKYQEGLRATMFRPGKDAGIGYLLGATDDPTVVKAAYLDQEASTRVATRARKLREAAGTLSGVAIGEDDSRGGAYDLLADLNVVFASAERLWSETICERLAELRPQVYRGWDAKALGAALKPYDLRSQQMMLRGDDGERINRWGLTQDQVRAAVETHKRRELTSK